MSSALLVILLLPCSSERTFTVNEPLITVLQAFSLRDLDPNSPKVRNLLPPLIKRAFPVKLPDVRIQLSAAPTIYTGKQRTPRYTWTFWTPKNVKVGSICGGFKHWIIVNGYPDRSVFRLVLDVDATVGWNGPIVSAIVSRAIRIEEQRILRREEQYVRGLMETERKRQHDAMSLQRSLRNRNE